MPAQSTSGTLEKAILIHQPQDNSKNIEFMFNPKELVFEHSMEFNESQGARTEQGYPKISFAYRHACTLRISNIIFDTYEQGESILGYLRNLIQSVYFADSGSAKNKRPPLYVFAWGNQQYFTCFVENLTYRLSRFLADGTPVQAVVDLTLKKVDEAQTQGGSRASVNRTGNTRW
jgi:hypothetical protein